MGSVIALGWWLFITLGCIYYVTESAFFRPVRVRLSRLHPLVETLLYCPACSGFWIGIGIGVWGLWPDALRIVGLGFASMGLGAMWGAYHLNTAWSLEAEDRDRGRLDDDTQMEIEDGS